MCDDCNKCCSMFWCSLYMFSALALIGTGMWMPIDSRVYDVTVMYNRGLESDKAAWNGVVAGMFIVGGWCLVAAIVGLAATGCMSRNALIAMSQEDISTTMQSNLVEYYDDDNGTSEFISAWNRYQVEYACCGMNNYTDYVNGAFYNITNGNPDVPWTCCVMSDQNKKEIDIGNVLDIDQCRQEADTSPAKFTYLNAQGCESSAVDNYKKYQVVFLSVCWTSAFVQIISMIAAGCLKSDLKVDFT